MYFAQELKLKLNKQKRISINSDGAIKSAILLLIVKRNEKFSILFTKRTDLVEHHKGQISFPGGAAEENDETSIETAIREANEEIGINKGDIEILGILNEVVTPSNFHITPVVGFVGNEIILKPNKNEIEEIFEIEIEKFYDDDKLQIEEREILGKMRKIYFYNVWREPIWGATAYFVKQLVDLIKNEN